MYSLKSLEAFHAVIKTGTVTAAADFLGSSQPALSRLLSSLEESLGFALFYREKARLYPTEEALILADEVEKTMASIGRFSSLAKNIKHVDSGKIVIAAPNSFISGPLAEVIAKFMADFPRVQVTIEAQNPKIIREQVALKQVDCGFIQLPDDAANLISYPIMTGKLQCVVHKDSDLSNRLLLSPDDLSNEPLVLLGKGRFSRININNAFTKAKVKPKVRLETHSVASACAFVRLGIGTAIVNNRLAKQYLDSRLVLVDFKPDIEVDYGFVVSAHTPMNRLTKRFFEYCQLDFQRG